MKRDIEVVLFDLGGTLVYFDASWPQAAAQASNELAKKLVTFGYSIEIDPFITTFSERMSSYFAERDTEFIEYTTEHVLKELLAEYGYCDVPKEHLRSAVDAMYEVTGSYWKAEADTIPMIELLLQQGYRIGAISNAADGADVRRIVDRNNLGKYFEILLISAEVGIRKPHPRIFHLALEYFHVAPYQAAMVGDTLGADILGAKNAGLASIWISRRADTAANRAHEDTIQPDAAITTLSELPVLLQTWSGK